MKHWKLILGVVVVLALSMIWSQGCRRVALVGDSLLGCSREQVVKAINNNDGRSWVYTEHLWPGSSSWNNPINRLIYGEGIIQAFESPDVVVFSFAGNDMAGVIYERVTMESAIQSMQTLINQAVVSGAMCVVMVESSHVLRGDFAHNPEFQMHMDDWFNHWHRQVGDKEHLGIPYRLLIADISEAVHADLDKYIKDYIHFTEAGAELIAAEITEQINQCPEGRWVFGEDRPKPDATFPKNPHKEYEYGQD